MSATKTNPESRRGYGPFFATRQPMSRRHFLRGAGVILSLPLFEGMLPTFGRAQPSSTPIASDAKPRRMFAVMQNLGFIPANFFPTGAGRSYVPSPYLELIQEHRDDFTVFSGVSLPNVDGGLVTQSSWLTGAAHPGRGNFRNTISLDQVVAGRLGHLTRFPSLTLAVNTRNHSLSVNVGGQFIPPAEKAADVFRLLFVRGSPDEVDAQVQRLETGRSILDTLTTQVKGLQRDLTPSDRDQLDQYVTSVRALEGRMQAAQLWEQIQKPVVSAPIPVDPGSPEQYFEKIKVMYDLATLVFQTDSTRAVTLLLDSTATPLEPITPGGPPPPPRTTGYYNVAHHGNSPEKLARMRALDLAHFKLLNGLLSGLKAAKEQGETLLDRTQLLWGSNFNDANAKVTTNLPIVFAGGGWKHGQHLVFIPKGKPPQAGAYIHAAFASTGGDYPLTNLHLSMLHRMGIPEKSFSSSTGEFQGLEMT